MGIMRSLLLQVLLFKVYNLEGSEQPLEPFITIEFVGFAQGWHTVDRAEDLAVDWEGLNLDSAATNCSAPGCPFLLLLVDKHVFKEVPAELHRGGGCASAACACSRQPHCLPPGRCCGGRIHFEVTNGPHAVELVLSRSRVVRHAVAWSAAAPPPPHFRSPVFSSRVLPSLWPRRLRHERGATPRRRARPPPGSAPSTRRRGLQTCAYRRRRVP